MAEEKNPEADKKVPKKAATPRKTRSTAGRAKTSAKNRGESPDSRYGGRNNR